MIEYFVGILSFLVLWRFLSREIRKSPIVQHPFKQSKDGASSLAKAAKNLGEFHIPVPAQADPEWVPPSFVLGSGDNDDLLLNNEGQIKCYDPSTGGYLDSISTTNVDEIPSLLLRAREAQHWFSSNTSLQMRKEFLKKLASYITKHQEDIANVACRDSGKTKVDAFFGEILTTLEKINWIVKEGEKVLQPEYRSVGLLTIHKLARVEYHPLGVVSAIVSWNYPFHNTFGPIVAALFAGNAIIIKPSEHVVWSTMRYFSILIRGFLEFNGLPSDLVQFVIGQGDVGEALVRSGVDKVTFIGSPAIGKKVMRAASDNLTPVVLELGGKDAAIIANDANLEQCIPIVLRGTFQNAGQNCVGLERLIVHEDIYDQFIDKVTSVIKKLKVGVPLGKNSNVDMGAVTMKHHLEHIDGLVQSAINEGAKLICGGKRAIVKNNPFGQFYEPTLLIDVKPTMQIAQTEVFGPVMTVMKYSTVEEAISIMNSTVFGLGSSVFTNSPFPTHLIKTGMININDFGINYLCQSLPFGGINHSGFGRFAGVEGLRGECRVVSMTEDIVSMMKTKIPTMLQYPMRSAVGWQFCEGLGGFVYGEDIIARASSLIALIKSCAQ